MAAITPGANAGLMAQAWTNTFEDAVYDKMAFIPNIRELEKLNNQLNIRKVARQSTSTLAQSDTGVTLTYSATNDTAATITPTGVYAAASFSKNMIAQLDISPDSPYRQNAESAVAEGMDSTALANVVSLSNSAGSYANPLDAATFRYVLSGIFTTARAKAEFGVADLHFVIVGARKQDLLNIPEFAHAHILGVSNGPTRTGVFVEAAGVTLHSSNVVNQTNAGADNPMFVSEAFGISYNMRPTVLVQDLELQHRIICFTNFGTGIVHDVRAWNVKTLKTL